MRLFGVLVGGEVLKKPIDTWPLLPVLLALAAPPALAQPVDDGLVETEIWYQLEEVLFGHTQGAIQAVGDAGQCVENDLARWRALLPVVCSSETCRQAAYWDRIASLNRLQAEAWRISEIDLPVVPALVAVLAPEDDEAETPKDFAAAPDFEARGRMVVEYDDPEHSGLALLNAENGSTHVLVHLMELGNSPNHEVVQSLAADEPDTVFAVRGGADAGTVDGILNFRSDHCRFVYRLPDMDQTRP